MLPLIKVRTSEVFPSPQIVLTCSLPSGSRKVRRAAARLPSGHSTSASSSIPSFGYASVRSRLMLSPGDCSFQISSPSDRRRNRSGGKVKSTCRWTVSSCAAFVARGAAAIGVPSLEESSATSSFRSGSPRSRRKSRAIAARKSGEPRTTERFLYRVLSRAHRQGCVESKRSGRKSEDIRREE